MSGSSGRRTPRSKWTLLVENLPPGGRILKEVNTAFGEAYSKTSTYPPSLHREPKSTLVELGNSLEPSTARTPKPSRVIVLPAMRVGAGSRSNTPPAATATGSTRLTAAVTTINTEELDIEF